jgi:hypothetical protein
MEVDLRLYVEPLGEWFPLLDLRLNAGGRVCGGDSLLDLISSAGYFCRMMVYVSSSAHASTSRGFPAGSFCASGALLLKLLDLRLPFGSK